MNDFKVGDKVKLKSGNKWGSKYPIATIKRIVKGLDKHPQIWVKESGTWEWSTEVELVEPLVKDLRKELSDAIDLLAKYSIMVGYRGYSDGVDKWGYKIKNANWYEDKECIIDNLLPLNPTKTPEQLEVEEIEKEMKNLAERLAKVKDKM